MKARLLTSIIMLFTLLLNGGLPTPASAADKAPAAPGGFVFVLRGSAAGSAIDRYSADAATGELALLGSTPTGGAGGLADSAHLLAYDAANARLFALNDRSSAISAFQVDRASGWLTPLPFSPIGLSDTAGPWTSLAVHPGGSPLIAGGADGRLATVRIFPLSTYGTSPQVGGALVGTFATGSTSPYALVVSANGASVYAAGSASPGLPGFSVDPSSANLTPLPGSPAAAAVEGVNGLAIDRAGRLFYADDALGDSDDTVGFKIATTSSAGAPEQVVYQRGLDGLTGVADGLYHPSAFYLAADRVGNQVGVYRVSGSGAGSSMAPVSGSPFATGQQGTQGLAVSAAGTLVYALNTGSRTITRFDFDLSSGGLSGPTQSAAPGAEGLPQGIVYAPYIAPAATGGFLYSLRMDGTAHQFIACYAAAGSGAPALLWSLPTGGLGDKPDYGPRLAYDKVNARLYVLNDADPGASVKAYHVDPATGALSDFFTLSLMEVGKPYGLAVHPTGSPLLVLGESKLYSYKVSGEGAGLVEGSPSGGVAGAAGLLTFSQDGRYVYLGSPVTSALAGFLVNPALGDLTALPGSPFEVGAAPRALVSDGLGRLLIAGANTAELKVATTSSGTPGVVSSLPADGLAAPVDGLLHPAGLYLVLDNTGKQVGVYRLTGSGAASALAPVSGSPFTTGELTYRVLALDETGRNLYASSDQAWGVIAHLRLDPITGALTHLAETAPAAAGAQLRGLVYVPKVTPGGFVYALHQDTSASQILGYRLDRATGALSLLNGFPMVTGGVGSSWVMLQSLAFDARNLRLYALNGGGGSDGSGTLSVYQVSPATGALTPLPYSPYTLPKSGTDQPYSIAVHPSGSPVVIGLAPGGKVISLKVGASGLSEAAGSPYFLAPQAAVNSLAFSADGRYLYTGGLGLYGFGVNPVTGVLTPVVGNPQYRYSTDGVLIPAAADGEGRLFISRFTADGIRVSAMASSGELATASTAMPVGLRNCTHISVHPGGYLLVSCQTDNVGVLRMAGSSLGTTLTLAGLGPVATPGCQCAHGLALDSSNRYLVVSNRNLNNLATFAFDPVTAALTPAAVQPMSVVGDANGMLTGLVYVPQWGSIYLPMVSRRP